MVRFKRGLVVGKFSPLHRGHERVIAQAMEQCDEVVLISYSKPEFPGCEAEKRERWLTEAFPHTTRLVVTDERLAQWVPDPQSRPGVPTNDAPDDVQRDFVGFLCSHVLGVEVNAVFTSEDYGTGFAARLTEYFRAAHPAAPAVQHVMVDRHRHAAPISATEIRADVHRNRQWLLPCVYASFVKRICVLGGESSGKSMLAQALADELGTRCVPEFARELWMQRDGRLSYEDLLLIGERQIAAEEAAAREAHEYLFCDTTPLTTLFYSYDMFGRADPALVRMADRLYDLCVLCAPDFPFVQDGTRRDAAFRTRQHHWYLDQLESRRLPYLLARGSLKERVADVVARL